MGRLFDVTIRSRNKLHAKYFILWDCFGIELRNFKLHMYWQVAISCASMAHHVVKDKQVQKQEKMFGSNLTRGFSCFKQIALPVTGKLFQLQPVLTSVAAYHRQAFNTGVFFKIVISVNKMLCSS